MKANQYWTPYWCGTQESFAQYLEEQPFARLGPYLPQAGSLCQRLPDADLVTGLGQRHLGDETPLQSWTPTYDAWAVIQMNNLAIGFSYLLKFPHSLNGHHGENRC